MKTLTSEILSSCASSIATELTDDATEPSDAHVELARVCELFATASDHAYDDDSAPARLGALLDPDGSADADAITRFRDAVRGLIEDDERDVALAVSFLLGWRARAAVEEAADLEALAE